MPVDAEPGDPDRPRQWSAVLMGRGFNVQLIHAAVLAPGEELTERPPRKALSWQEWVSTHADYGLDVNGRELESS